MVIAIDWLAYHFRFDSGEGVYEEIFEKPDFVDIILRASLFLPG